MISLSQLQDSLRNKILDVSIDKWNVGKHTAAFDCIHDTDLALDTYLDKNVVDAGENILFIYGTLQALVVLIDSVTCIYQDFYDPNFKKHDNAIFKKCINYRNMAIGHPVITDQKHSKLIGYSHFILRHKTDKYNLYLQSRNSDDDEQWVQTHICLKDLIGNVRSESIRLFELILIDLVLKHDQ